MQFNITPKRTICSAPIYMLLIHLRWNILFTSRGPELTQAEIIVTVHSEACRLFSYCIMQ